MHGRDVRLFFSKHLISFGYKCRRLLNAMIEKHQNIKSRSEQNKVELHGNPFLLWERVGRTEGANVPWAGNAASIPCLLSPRSLFYFYSSLSVETESVPLHFLSSRVSQQTRPKGPPSTVWLGRSLVCHPQAICCNDNNMQTSLYLQFGCHKTALCRRATKRVGENKVKNVEKALHK